MAHGHHHHGHSHGHGHGHGHGHSHGHDHAHHPPPERWDRAFAIGIALNLVYVVAEGVAGFVLGSVALLADAGHNLSDVLGLAIAWGGAALARSAPSKRFTYGLKGSTILAALANALLLLVAIGAIAMEAIQRLGDPAPVRGLDVALVAGLGIAVNAVTAWLFARGRKGDVNIRGAYLHMLSDAVVSAGVVAAGIAIWATGAAWLDPMVSLVIAALIFWQTWGLLRETVEMALAAVPRGIDYDGVHDALAALPGVTAVHDLHIWPMSTTEPGMTAHLLIPGGHPGDAFLGETQEMLHRRFGIGHATIQIETGDHDADCKLADPARV
ncbi:cation transporter [Sphingomonas ginsenosidimutans]|jgi:cobalt-zinc-cadmium efflux system protein|uniref:Cation transporter n=1 Tax=Sphingomonas ginsenosidimutans TaxID=862134 RepID=A0A2A4HXV5_9SPHN|nr:cation diffusion facilitator family transporter [Sphingomonas ginsenosidimutans]PCG08515.1 cation transporter [Sphingomonas ginsenosidimutans]